MCSPHSPSSRIIGDSSSDDLESLEGLLFGADLSHSQRYSQRSLQLQLTGVCLTIFILFALFVSFTTKSIEAAEYTKCISADA